MQAFTSLTSQVMPLAMDNVDTDMIIPAQYLTMIDKQGYGEHVFQRLKDQDAAFVFNDPQYQQAQILLAGDNFGCGSSREHAVWALLQAGIKVMIAQSYSDIFYSNAAKNGLLLIKQPAAVIGKLMQQAMDGELILTIDLAAQQVQLPDGDILEFTIEPYRKECLLSGKDDLDYLLDVTSRHPASCTLVVLDQEIHLKGYLKMHKKIAVLAGDGIGPEVMQSTLQVLNVISQKNQLNFEYLEAPIGGDAYERTGEHCPESTLAACQAADAILFGSVGGAIDQQYEPKWRNCEANSILKLRKHFDLAVNIRPIKIYPELAHLCPLQPALIKGGVEMLIFRELTGGIYFGRHQELGHPGSRSAFDDCSYTEEQILTIAHAAFKAATMRSKRLCSVDKANVLATSKLWRQVVTDVAREYPEVTLSHMLVDNCAMQLVINPQQFDVLVTENMFGDILSDLAAALPGSLGLIPSASFNRDGKGLYEPSGGSAPSIAGLGIANPCAQLLSAAMMLRHSFALPIAAEQIEQAVTKVIAKGLVTKDLAVADAYVSTDEFITAVIEELARL